MTPSGHVVLVVDNDACARSVTADGLRRAGMTVLEAADECSAQALLDDDNGIDMVVLDVALPGANGLRFLSRLRAASMIPIIVLTDRDTDVDRIMGLEMGADDYLVKPCANRELTARVMGALRRRDQSGAAAPDRTRVGMDLGRRELRVDGRPVEVTRMEFDLLACLMTHRGRVLSRQELLDLVWTGTALSALPTVTEHVRRLRLALEGSDGPALIRTVRGLGYVYDG
ncbi:MAG: response regulator transcription factor [Mycobacteriales bacterium]|nr:response regulator transcription factor [Mycobacteriales bacterium]